MAKFVIENKVYDTDKMTLIGKVDKWYEFEGWLSKQLFGEGVGRVYDCELFRSAKGNYLLTRTNDCGQLVGQAIDENEAKKLLLKSDYESYVSIYGELEEA